MITNLLASVIVTLVTNTATVDNAEYSWNAVACPEKQIGCLVLHTERGEVTKPATQKTETTTVTEKTEYQIEAGGKKQRIAVSERIVSQEAKVYNLKQEWKLAETYDPRTRVELSHIATGDITFSTSFGTITITNEKLETDIP